MFAGSLVFGCYFPCHFFGICSCLATALELRIAVRLKVLIGLMAYWFGRFSMFCFCCSSSSAEMCAGSLAPGCRILGMFAARSQVYGAHGCHLACLVSLLWRPGGPLDDPGTILAHWRAQGMTLRGPGLDLIDFVVDLLSLIHI